ncbi:MAG: carboxylesterase family protein [Streptosporangiales bacterium]|nr:carboxylesterase family protein [Streptosporangiales bacterium]
MNRSRLFALVVPIVLTLLVTVGSPAAAATGGAVVRTSDGAVRGTATEDHRIFQGIPYAQPPVGELRLRAPRPNQPWTGIRDATEPGSSCAQVYVYPPGSPPTFTGDEDCLDLNVHVPKGATGPLPVMLFFHGGGSPAAPAPVTTRGGSRGQATSSS